MPDSQVGALKRAISDIRKLSKSQSTRAAGRKAEEHCREIAGRDYDLVLKSHFDRRQLRQILREVRRSLPTLNREVYRVTDLRSLARIAAGLGAVLRPRPFPGSDGTGFRGFYVGDAEILKRPSIWVNTATHPGTVAATFWHEVGHHLTNRIWGVDEDPVSAAFGPSYRDHLSDPKEIAADLVRVLGGYPKPIAQRLFGGTDMEKACYDADVLVGKALSHVRVIMGFDFRNQFSSKENVNYLGGMIHTAKLRMTLLSEYGI